MSTTARPLTRKAPGAACPRPAAGTVHRGHRRLTRAVGIVLGTLAILALLYATVIGPWQRRWGATDDEVARAMLGDDLVANPLEVTTRAVTVDAAPEYVWPWLVQMGNNRGGLYSYDGIDLLIGALDQPSVDRVLPEFQNLQVSDVMPYAKGSDFVVRALEPNRALVIQLPGEANVVQSWGLYPVDAQHTRLVLRVRAAIPVTPQLVPALLVLDPSEGFMVRQQLLGIKQRAEALAAQEPTEYTAIDRYVQSQVDANAFPGVALAIVEGGSIAHARGFGHDGQGQAVTPQTPFMIGSNSKSFTALAIMQLVETGKLDLDAPVQRYVPAFQLADPAASASITVRQLLTHTSGLPTNAGGDIPFGVRDAPLAEGLAALSTVDLGDAPGAGFRYSNAGYLVLGTIVEAVAQEPYAVYVQQHIFEPLQMTHTRLVSEDLAGYRYWFGGPLPFRMEYSTASSIVPAGGVISTAEDMSRYLAMYLNHGAYEGRTLLSAASIAEMHQGVAHVALQEGGENVEFDVAMGWIVGHVAGEPAIYHIGGSPNFSSWMILLPEANRAVITLTNVNNFIPGPGIAAFERIPVGTVALLKSGAPPSGMTMPTMYGFIDLFLVAILAVQVWSWIRLLRRPLQVVLRPEGIRQGLVQARQTALPLLWELGLSTLLLVAFPRLYDSASWQYVLDYTPDLGLAVLLVIALWWATGVTRVTKTVRSVAAVSEARAPRLQRAA